MSSSRKAVWFGVSALLLIGIVFCAYGFAMNALGNRIAGALGEGGRIGSVKVGLRGVDITDLHVKARSNTGKAPWPTDDELYAHHVHIEPDLRSIFSGNFVIRLVEIEDAKLTLLRTLNGLEILPGLRGDSGPKTSKPANQSEHTRGPKIEIQQIRLSRGEIDFFDATVRRKPHQIALHDITAEIRQLTLPELASKTEISIQGHVGESGSVSLSGWLIPANSDSELKLTLNKVPARTVEPYLVRNPAGHITGGALDLTLAPSVTDRKLNAPGKLTLDHLELSGENDFLGLTQRGAMALLRDEHEKIELSFTLDGRLDDPRFSLNEELYLRIGASLADTVGIGVSKLGRSVGQGLGGLIKGLTGK
jgi:hypothetical protein